MLANLLEAVIKNLGYETLHKVDPNEQEVKEPHRLSANEKLHQAAVPAVLTAFSLFAVTGKGVSMNKIKNSMVDQRQTILQYLPASLQLGELLEDGSMDDRTHKMKGPMSNIAHIFEKKLPGGEKPPEKKA